VNYEKTIFNNKSNLHTDAIALTFFSFACRILSSSLWGELKHFTLKKKIQQLGKNKLYRKIPVRLKDKETARPVQVLVPCPIVLGPGHKHQSTLPHPLGGQGPKGTAKWL
jgi:hypothetical protein